MNDNIGSVVVEHPTAEKIAYRGTGLRTEHQEIAAQLFGVLFGNSGYQVPYSPPAEKDTGVSVHQNICIGIALDILHDLRKRNLLLEFHYRRILENILPVMLPPSIATTGVVAASEDC